MAFVFGMLFFFLLIVRSGGFLDLLDMVPLKLLVRPMMRSIDMSGMRNDRCKKDFMIWFNSLEGFIDSISEECPLTDIGCYSKRVNLSNKNTFAVEQLDSFGRVPSNVLGFTTFSMGSWEECLNVGTPDYPNYKTQFCYVSIAATENASRAFVSAAGLLPLASSLLQIRNVKTLPTGIARKASSDICDAHLVIQWSICVPRSCSNSDVNVLLHSLNTITGGSIKFCKAECRSQYGPPKDLAFWIVVGYTLAGVSLVFAASVFDYWTESEEHYGNRQSIALRCFLSFSMYTNGAQILDVTKSPRAILSIHCIKAVSITWVIAGHALGLYMIGDNPMTPMESTYYILNDAFINGFFSVDSFFFIGGLLTSYVFLRQITSNPSYMTSPAYWFQYYLHRFVRIAPAYFLFLGFTIEMFDHVRIGPVPLDGMIDIEQCRKGWWMNVLFVNDMYDRLGKCMGHSWYVASDTKFYMLAPLIMVPLFYSERVGYLLSFVCLFMSTVANYVAYFLYDFPANYVGFFANIYNEERVWEYEKYIYKAPWIRFTPYLMGILTGHFLNKTSNKRIHLHWLVIVFLWILSGAMAIFIIYGLYDYFKGPDHEISIFARASYNCLSKLGWSMFLAWVIIACERNWAGPIKNFMELGFWAPFSRLTYCVYLSHILIMAFSFSMGRHAVHFVSTTHAYIRESIPVFVLSFLFSFIWSCTFEIPFIKIEGILLKIFFGQRSPKVERRNSRKQKLKRKLRCGP